MAEYTHCISERISETVTKKFQFLLAIIKSKN